MDGIPALQSTFAGMIRCLFACLFFMGFGLEAFLVGFFLDDSARV